VCGPARARTLVVRGKPGIGKTLLIDDLAGRPRSAGWRAVGMQSQMEPAFAGCIG
jgi:hypothetical protein